MPFPFLAWSINHIAVRVVSSLHGCWTGEPDKETGGDGVMRVAKGERAGLLQVHLNLTDICRRKAAPYSPTYVSML